MKKFPGGRNTACLRRAEGIEVGIMMPREMIEALIGPKFVDACMRGYGATAARLTPDQKVGSSNLSALI